MTLTLEMPTRKEAADNGSENDGSENNGLDFNATLPFPDDPNARERLAVLLYDLRAVSQGKAAKIAGLTRAGFIDALGRHGVTPFQYEDADDLRADVETLEAIAAGRQPPVRPL